MFISFWTRRRGKETKEENSLKLKTCLDAGTGPEAEMEQSDTRSG